MVEYVHENGKRIYVRGTRTDADREYSKNWMAKKRLDADYRKSLSLKSRKYQKAHPLEFGFSNARKSAIARGYVWELDQATFNRLWLADCTYCGAAPSPMNGIDRVDNSIGYTVANSVTACADCNYGKRKMSVSEFMSWARRVVQFNQRD